MRKLGRTITAVLLAGAVLAGTAIAVGTHEEYVSEVNPICKSFIRKAKKIPSQVEADNPIVRGVLTADRFAKLLGKTIRRITAVKPPAEDAAPVKKWIGGLRLQKDALKDFVKAAKARQRGEAAAAIRKAVRLGPKNREKAAKLGLPACAKRVNLGS